MSSMSSNKSKKDKEDIINDLRSKVPKKIINKLQRRWK